MYYINKLAISLDIIKMEITGVKRELRRRWQSRIRNEHEKKMTL